MAIHNQLYSEYQSFPGRQIEYVVVPRKHPHYFFEGIQSVDATNNSDEVNHGQFGFKQDVIIQRDYSNTSGTVSLKEFNNISYVLRGMTGADPTKTFIFDPSRLEHVDVCANVYNKTRDKVLRSTWLVDFTPSLSENESLDDIQTRDLNYTSIRKIDFEGYQIVHQEWFSTDVDNEYGAVVKGAQDFTLKYPAVIDPVVAFAELDTTTTYSENQGMIIGKGRHELCPIQFMLRVIVNGEVLDDPAKATVTTTVTGSSVVSVLHLSEPLPLEDGNNSVVAFWLSDGNKPYGATAITSAPVMSSASLYNDIFNASDKVTYSSSSWDGGLKVYFSAPLGNVNDNAGNIELTGLKATSGTDFKNLSLRFVINDSNTAPYTATRDSLGYAQSVGVSSGTQAQFTNAGLITRNVLDMQFTPNTDINTALSSPTLESIDFYLTYQAVGGVLPLYGYDSNELTPAHTIHMSLTPDGMIRIFD